MKTRGRKIKPIELPEDADSNQKLHYQVINPLREALDKYGITRQELADELGIDMSTVRDWINVYGQNGSIRLPQYNEFFEITNAIRRILQKQGNKAGASFRPYYEIIAPGEKTDYEKELLAEIRALKSEIKELEQQKQIIKVNRIVKR